MSEINPISTADLALEALNRHVTLLQEAAGENLHAVVLYGGLARGRYRPGLSDINLLIVLNDASAPALSRIAPVLRAAWRELRVEPFLLQADELSNAARLFPVKFLDIRQHHRLLAGRDVLQTVELKPRQVLQRIEQELSNAGMRLRRRFINSEADPAALAAVLASMVVPLAVDLAALLSATDQAQPADDAPEAVFDRAASSFGLDRPALSQLAALRSSATTVEDVKVLAGKIMDAIAQVAAIAREKGASA